jgi:hypothetical protein
VDKVTGNMAMKGQGQRTSGSSGRRADVLGKEVPWKMEKAARHVHRPSNYCPGIEDKSACEFLAVRMDACSRYQLKLGTESVLYTWTVDRIASDLREER